MTGEQRQRLKAEVDARRRQLTRDEAHHHRLEYVAELPVPGSLSPSGRPYRVTHGTLAAYRVYGCRCESCRAKSAADRRRHRRAVGSRA